MAAAPSCGSGFLDGLTGGHRDAGPSGSSALSDACILAHAPERPDAAKGSSPGVNLVFAVEALRFGTAQSLEDAGVPPPTGLDLDNTCTCHPDPESCTRPDASEPHCDGPNGQDNGMATFFDRVATLSPLTFSQDFATARIALGVFTVLIEVLQWNGESNDPSVTVTLRMSPGLDTSGDAGSGRPTPAFDGTDVWTIDPDSVVSGDQLIGVDCRGFKNPGCFAKYSDGNAYVMGNNLVANWTDTPLRLMTSVGPLVIDFRTLTLVAEITTDDGGTGRRLRGQFVGRWPEGRLLDTLGNLKNPFRAREGGVLCTDEASYALAKGYACDALDLPQSISAPRTAPCDTLSVAVAVAAGPATASVIARQDPKVSQCSGATDSCPR
jgi:hypothetical protein